jgi:hypothetical protein
LNIADHTVDAESTGPAVAARGRLARRTRCHRRRVICSTTRMQSGLECSHAFYHRARPTRVPSALHQKQIALVEREDVERFERSDQKK